MAHAIRWICSDEKVFDETAGMVKKRVILNELDFWWTRLLPDVVDHGADHDQDVDRPLRDLDLPSELEDQELHERCDWPDKDKDRSQGYPGKGPVR